MKSSVGKYRAALFDLDNTLVDTEPLHYQAYSSVIAELGLTITPEERVRIIGVPADINFRRVVEEHHIVGVNVAELVAKRQARYLELIQTAPIHLLPGALEILEWMESHGVPRIIASSSKTDQVALTIERTPLRRFFADRAFVTFEDVPPGRGKPFPDIFIEAAKRVGFPPTECVVFEDAPAGVEAGHAASCYCIAIPNEYTAHGDFSKADLVMRSLAEVNCATLFKM